MEIGQDRLQAWQGNGDVVVETSVAPLEEKLEEKVEEKVEKGSVLMLVRGVHPEREVGQKGAFGSEGRRLTVRIKKIRSRSRARKASGGQGELGRPKGKLLQAK